MEPASVAQRVVDGHTWPATRTPAPPRLRRNQGRAGHVARRGDRRGQDATVLGRGGAGFPAGVKWGFCPPGWPLHRRQRRRVRAGHLQGTAS